MSGDVLQSFDVVVVCCLDGCVLMCQNCCFRWRMCLKNAIETGQNVFSQSHLLYRFSKLCVVYFVQKNCVIFHAWLFVTPPSIGERSIVMSMSVCLSVCVCLPVHDHIFRTTSSIFTKFFVHVTYGRGSVSSGGIVIRYVLPVLWMMSYLLTSQDCSTSLPS